MAQESARANELMTAADAARILGLSSDMVRILARRGRLRPAVRSVRGVRLFRRADVEALAAERAGVRGHHHIVQFYSDENCLCGLVADFLREGMNAGGPVVVIATAPHREAVCARLALEGLDVQQKLASEQLTLLDARETLGRISVNGLPNAERFQSHVGGLIAGRVAEARARVRAYGEMVDLLWKDVQPDAARQLEALWNDLADAHPFFLLCAYEMANFSTGDDTKPFQQICELHTRVVPVDGHIDEAAPELRDLQIALLQQRAHALDGEVERRKKIEAELREVKAELERQLARAAGQGSST